MVNCQKRVDGQSSKFCLAKTDFWFAVSSYSDQLCSIHLQMAKECSQQIQIFVYILNKTIFNLSLNVKKMRHFESKYLFISCILLHQCNTKPLPHKKQHYCTKVLQMQCNSPTMTKTCLTLGECNSIQCSRR